MGHLPQEALYGGEMWYLQIMSVLAKKKEKKKV